MLTSQTSAVMAEWPGDKAEMGIWLQVSSLQTFYGIDGNSVVTYAILGAAALRKS